MASFIYIDKDRLKISPTTKVIKAATYSNILAAEHVLAQARKTAEQIVTAAKAAAEEIQKEAESIHREDRNKGYQEGLEAAKQKMATHISAVAVKTDQYHHSLEEAMAALVMETVRKVIGEIDKNELIVGLVRKALVTLKSQKQLVLKVTPAQVDHINERLAEIMDEFPRVDTIEVRGDERLGPDHLILESRLGIVDAGIETQLAAIKEAFAICFKK